ncbi:MAG: integration host factor subunit beta [Planctomycetes bacterium]|nr:integration host factor subunit beta [Planctomycetota bacterium]
MNKKEMVRRIASELNVEQVLVGKIVQRCLDTILETLATTGRVELRNFGVFKVKRRAARKARNPRLNTEIKLPPRNIIYFQPGKNVAKMIAKANPKTVACSSKQ